MILSRTLALDRLSFHVQHHSASPCSATTAHLSTLSVALQTSAMMTTLPFFDARKTETLKHGCTAAGRSPQCGTYWEHNNGWTLHNTTRSMTVLHARNCEHSEKVQREGREENSNHFHSMYNSSVCWIQYQVRSNLDFYLYRSTRS